MRKNKQARSCTQIIIEKIYISHKMDIYKSFIEFKLYKYTTFNTYTPYNILTSIIHRSSIKKNKKQKQRVKEKHKNTKNQESETTTTKYFNYKTTKTTNYKQKKLKKNISLSFKKIHNNKCVILNQTDR